MRRITVRIPDPIASEIEEESRKRDISKSDVIRERLGHKTRSREGRTSIADLIGSVEGLPAGLSRPSKTYLARR